MAKKKATFEIYSYGIYSKWDKSSKQLPKLMDVTTRIPIQPDIEFGYILKAKAAKGLTLKFRIEHPPMKDENNDWLPSFEGEEIINSNDFAFFLGDTVWPPYEQMQGDWKLLIWCNDKVVAEKKFLLYLP